jgi:hypothetical protein
MAALALKGIKTDGPMAAEIPLDRQRPAEYVFSRHVAEKLAAIEKPEPGAHKLDAKGSTAGIGAASAGRRSP